MYTASFRDRTLFRESGTISMCSASVCRHAVVSSEKRVPSCAYLHAGDVSATCFAIVDISFFFRADAASSATCETLCRGENAISGCNDDVVDDVIDVVSCTIQTHHCGPSTKEANFQNLMRKLQREDHGLFRILSPLKLFDTEKVS